MDRNAILIAGGEPHSKKQTPDTIDSQNPETQKDPGFNTKPGSR